MLIRAAQPVDLLGIQTLAAQAPTAAQWKGEDYQRIFDVQNAPRRHALVAEDGEAVMAFIVARELGAEWEIENVVVASAARRRGIARQLLRAMLDLAQKRGATKIFLEVRQSNEAARGLYEKLGFSCSGQRKAYYQRPEEDALLFEFSFSSPQK